MRLDWSSREYITPPYRLRILHFFTTMPRLRVVAGPSLDALEPITVNTGKAHKVSSPLFDGKILAYIKDFPGEDGNILSSEYFERPERKGVTWSIQVQGVY